MNFRSDNERRTSHQYIFIHQSKPECGSFTQSTITGEMFSLKKDAFKCSNGVLNWIEIV
jgi:hypothetical protein